MFYQIVDRQFNEPNLPLAFLFYLLPTIFWVAFLAVFGFAINANGILVSTLFGLLEFLLVSGAFYALLMAFKGKGAKGSFISVLSAYSVTFLIIAIVSLVAFAVVFLIVPGFFQAVALLHDLDVSENVMLAVVNSLEMPLREVAFLGLAVIGIAVLIGLYAGLHVIYRIGKLSKETSAFSNMVFTVACVGAILLIDFALRFTLQLLF